MPRPSGGPWTTSLVFGRRGFDILLQGQIVCLYLMDIRVFSASGEYGRVGYAIYFLSNAKGWFSFRACPASVMMDLDPVFMATHRSHAKERGCYIPISTKRMPSPIRRASWMKPFELAMECYGGLTMLPSLPALEKTSAPGPCLSLRRSALLWNNAPQS